MAAQANNKLKCIHTDHCESLIQCSASKPGSSNTSRAHTSESQKGADGTNLSSHSLLVSSNAIHHIANRSGRLLQSIRADRKHLRVFRRLAYTMHPTLESSSVTPFSAGAGCCAYLVLIGDCTGKQSPNAHANIPLRGSETLRSCYAGVK